MSSWIDYLRRGLSRSPSTDRVTNLQGETSTRSNLRNLRPFFLRHWRKGALGFILVILTSLLAYPQPLITRYLIDGVILDRQLDKLWIVLLLLGGIKILSMVFGGLQQFYITRFEQIVILDIQSDLFERLLHYPKSFFDETETGYLMSRLQEDVQRLQWFFSQTIVTTFNSAFRLLGGVGFLFYLEWRLALAVLVILPIFVVILNYFSRKLRILSRQRMEQQANVARNLQESLASTTLIKTFAAEKRTVGRMVSEWKDAQQLNLEQTMVGSLASLLVNALPNLANGVVLIVGAYLAVQGDWTLGSLLAFQSYLGYVYGPAMMLAATNLQMQDALASLARVSALYSIIPEENLGVGLHVERLKGEVVFMDVSFSYDGRDTVFQNLSFRIAPGEHIVIAGPSGVGKTTLISLLMQFYRPTRGEILLDGLPAAQYELSSLRERIGYVSQSTLLLAGTIRENLCYGNLDATQEQIDQATWIAGIRDFILGLPDGYDAAIGERGVNLSDGQKQRFSIARALIKDPDIIILDEPTSAVDALVEQTIFDALPEVVHEKTLIVVTHRLSTIKRADRILLLKDGHLDASGTHTELLERNPYYRSLFIG